MTEIINMDFDVEKFTREIDILCERDVNFLEAILHWCEINNMEIETIIPIIKKDVGIKSRLMMVADKMNLLKKVPKLPESFED